MTAMTTSPNEITMTDEPTDLLHLRQLSLLRTVTIASRPGTVALEITTADGQVQYFGLPASQLGRLAKRLAADAALMAGKGGRA